MNGKSVQEVSKQKSTSKMDVRYWKPRVYRNSFTRDGARSETADWCIKLAHGGRRETINLRTSNADAAAGRARDVYRAVIADGWDRALQIYKPRRQSGPEEAVITLGNLFTVAEQRAVHVRPTTLRYYIGCLRQIAADIADVERSEDRYDYVNGGSGRWRAIVDALPLRTLAGESLREWQTAYVKARGNDEKAIRSAKVSANTISGNARRMFTPEMLNHYRDAGLSITENPFAALKPFKKGDSRYISRIDPVKVLDRAYRELVKNAPATAALKGIAALNAKKGASDPPQVYRVILLGTMTGLRRSELDRLQWSHIDFSRGCLTVQSTSDGTVKAAGSTRDVDLPADLMELLNQWKAQSRGLYVIECANPHKVGASFRNYRCGRIFDKASAWLREQFLPGENHPLHTLRKEYGSLITQSAGIHAAADLLGHRDIRTASEYYVVRKTRTVTGLAVPQAPTRKAKPRKSATSSK